MVQRVRIRPHYDENKTYPILVRLNGYHLIVEMLGKDVNEWNRKYASNN